MLASFMKIAGIIAFFAPSQITVGVGGIGVPSIFHSEGHPVIFSEDITKLDSSVHKNDVSAFVKPYRLINGDGVLLAGSHGGLLPRCDHKLSRLTKIGILNVTEFREMVQSNPRTIVGNENWRSSLVDNFDSCYWILVNSDFMNFSILKTQIGSELPFPNFASDHNCVSGRLVSLMRVAESQQKQDRADTNEHCGVERVIPHILSRPLYSLCGRVHSLLGGKVSYLPFAGFFFAALSGFGLGIILDNFNPDRRPQWFGWIVLSLCLPISYAAFLLGLP